MRRREQAVLLALGAAALVASGIAPKDRFTWFPEVAPIFVAALRDMLWALIGSIGSQLLLSRPLEREIAALSARPGPGSV